MSYMENEWCTFTCIGEFGHCRVDTFTWVTDLSASSTDVHCHSFENLHTKAMMTRRLFYSRQMLLTGIQPDVSQPCFTVCPDDLAVHYFPAPVCHFQYRRTYINKHMRTIYS